LAHAPAKQAVHRIIDANVNRAKEGLRVCEEIARFVLGSRQLTAEIKNIRHGLDAASEAAGVSLRERLTSRNTRCDVGRTVHEGELSRTCQADIFYANIQRVKESLRVLEEFFKLLRPRAALKAKALRYRVYAVEKKITQRLSSLI
jgi:thiamine-phosphate pyrophosphorylase